MKKRMYVALALFVVFFSAVIIRLAFISLSGAYRVSEGYNSYSIVLDTLEPNLYCRNAEKLTNNVTVKYALLKPNVKTVEELGSYFDDTDEIIKELEQGKPLLKKVTASEHGYIQVYDSTVTENTCKQLLSRESSGLMCYLPQTVGERKLRFYVDAKGKMLSGEKTETVDNNYSTSEGLLLTLDKNVQNITYEAAGDIKSGCVIVMDVTTSEILSCVTKPDSSYINKPFTLYTAGSVFKLVIAAAALENGINPVYTCNGSIRAGNTVYSCQNKHKHGEQKIKEALENSCNCYFVNLALTLGADKIKRAAEEYGFGEILNLYSDWQLKNAVLPSLDEMKNGDLPLIGFGQGKLTVTPVQLCNFLCTVGSGGLKRNVTLVKANVDKYGNRTEYETERPERVMSKRNAYLLLRYMRGVVENGTGKNADYNSLSAGKTATAQTGQFINGRELLNTWFIGVYPNDNPKYAIVVMSENGTSGAENCCPVFRTIVEKLTSM